MEVPTSMLLCPITLATFRNPVVAEDGNTYEKEAIEEWIRKNGTSPITNAKISEDLFPNRTVIKMIDQFETSLRDKNYQYTLDVDVKRKKGRPSIQTSEKTIYHAEWLPDNNGRPDIVLLKIDGARAKKDASLYVDLNRHSHIVRTFGLVREERNDTNAVILLQEYASLGSLHKLLSQQKQPLAEKILIEIFLQIFDAMSYLALNNVAHGDLACRNVLVFRFDEKDPRNIVVKLTDFGLSHRSKIYTQFARAAKTSLSTIPVRYSAPELLWKGVTPNDCTEKSDVYAMGVLMWEAYSRGAVPWSNIQNDEYIIQRVKNGDMLPQPANCNPQYWNILVKTWSPIPSERPTFGQLKKLFEDQLYSDRMSVSSPSMFHISLFSNEREEY
jgi:serine/threonine protein kinase